jgi:acetyltransferase EpsM
MSERSSLPLVLIGAGGLARELIGWIARDTSWQPPVAMVQEVNGESILGINVVNFESINFPVRFLLAVSEPDLKEKFSRIALLKGWLPESYIDKSSVVGLNVTIGCGCIINPLSTISSNTVIGNFVTLNCRSSVGHESKIGDYSTLLGSNQVNGYVQVADHVVLGAGSIIHPGRLIGSWATVGIGSVVVTNVKSKTVVFGNPAKRISSK